MDEARLRQLKLKGDFYSARKEERERARGNTWNYFVAVDRRTRYIRAINQNIPRLLSFSLKHSGLGSSVLSVRDYAFDNVAPFSSSFL